VLIYSVPFVASSYAGAEVSASPGGLPLRWLIKAVLPVAFFLLLMTVIARMIRVWHFLFLSSHLDSSAVNDGDRHASK
jgi:TRAP-type mannitol/chloroaromatic compound transport system permease small subunit